MALSPQSTARVKRSRLQQALIASVAFAGVPFASMAQTPLEGFATRIVNFETANTLSQGTLSLQAGSHQTGFDSGTGTGSQLYYGAADYAFTDDLQLGFTAQVVEDPPISPILGSQFPTRFTTAGVSLKYRFVNNGPLQVSALASVEYLEFRTAHFGTNVSEANHVIGSVQMPITYTVNPQLQFHVTPGVSVLPDDLNGIDYYGTVGFVGAGVTWKPSDRFQAFGALNMPVSGGNTIESDRSISDMLTYTIGARYLVTPKVSLEGYVTNAIGISPATSVLTFWPNGDEPLIGLRATYTPGKGLRDTYRSTPLSDVTHRVTQLQQDGFTVGSAGVLEPGDLRFSASGGDDDNYAVAVALGLDRDFQIDAVIEDFSKDGSVGLTGDPTPNSARWMAGGRMRFLDQNNGDPFSLSARVLGGRDIETLDVGVLYLSFPMSYQVNDQLTLHVEPKATAFGNTRIGGLGIGANYEMFDGLQLIGEVTPVSEGNNPVWAAGMRYDMPNAGFSVDLSATNSIGRYGAGTMVAQDSTRFGVGVSFATGIFSR